MWSGCLFESFAEKVREIRRFEGMPVPKQCENVSFYILHASSRFCPQSHVLGDTPLKATKPFNHSQKFAANRCCLLDRVLPLEQPVAQGSADRLAFASRAMIWQSFQALQISQCYTYPFCGVLKKEHLWYNRNLGKSSLWNPEQNFLSCRHGFVLFGTEQSGL